MGCKSDGVGCWGKISMEIKPISCLDVLPEEDYAEDSDEATVLVREDMLTSPKRLEEPDREVEELILRKE